MALTIDQWKKINEGYYYPSTDMSKVEAQLKKEGYVPIQGSYKNTAWLVANKGLDKYTEVLIKGGDPVAQMGADALGRPLTDAELKQVHAAYNDFAGKMNDPNVYGQFANKFLQAPELMSTEIAKNKAEQQAKELIDKQSKTINERTTSLVNDPNSIYNQILNIEKSNIQENTKNQSDVATQQLINELAARGVSVGGGQGGVSGAFAGGEAAIAKNIAENYANPATQAANLQFQQAVANDASQFGQTGLGLTTSQINQYNQDIATQMANDYQAQQAQKYYDEMEKLASYNQPTIWNALLGGAGAVAGGIAGLAGGPAGVISGANAGLGLGNSIGGLFKNPGLRR